MITTEQFELKLIEYLDGELSDAEKREVEEYLQAHPEAIELKGDFSRLCAAGKIDPRVHIFPRICSWKSNRKLAARLADSRQEHVASTPIASNNGSPETTPSRTWLPNWRRRFRPPVLAAALAALAILLVGAVTQRAALADIANSLLQRIVVTFNDESLSDSQQQTFDELVEITETVDENGDQVVTINADPAISSSEEFGDEGVALKVRVIGEQISDAEVESANAFLDSFETALTTALHRDHDHDIDQAIVISAAGVPHGVYAGSSDSTVVEAIFLGDITKLNLDSLNLDSLQAVSDSLIARRCREDRFPVSGRHRG